MPPPNLFYIEAVNYYLWVVINSFFLEHFNKNLGMDCNICRNVLQYNQIIKRSVDYVSNRKQKNRRSKKS